MYRFVLCAFASLLVLVVVVALPAGLEPVSSAESAVPEKKEGANICPEKAPCGWAIYEAFTRQISYFMRNICVCASNQKCLMVSDDLSVRAYVYQCLANKTNTS